MIHEGYLSRSIKTYDYKVLLDFCCGLDRDGYFMYSATKTIMWPFFWIVEYEATFRKEFLHDDEANQLEFIPHNLLENL